MKLVFMGTADFAVPALEALSDSVALVVSQPDRPTGRRLQLRPSPVKSRALELGLPVETPAKSRAPEFIERIISLEADALLVAAYGQILSSAMLASTRRGGINLHGSLLPKYRGAAPIQRCIEHGDTVTGVTLMQMDVGMDTGDIVATTSIPIGPDETAGELFDRLAAIAASMAKEWMPRVVAGDYPRTAQNPDMATHAPKVAKEEAQLDFFGDVQTEYRKFRAFTPSPGAFLLTSLGHVKISRARLLLNATVLPGRVVFNSGKAGIGFKDGAMELLEVQPEGKKRMSGQDFMNGARLKNGDCLVP